MSDRIAEPKYKKAFEGVESLSLGISMVVAVVIGVAIGIGLKTLTGWTWTLWIGVIIGIGAAINNVYKAYKKQVREFDEIAKERGLID
jgi:F0F1-type ATP synthase assembly protein I